MKKAKGALDASFRESLAKCQRLEQELSFYQTQSALAMADRDRLTAEVDEVRRPMPAPALCLGCGRAGHRAQGAAAGGPVRCQLLAAWRGAPSARPPLPPPAAAARRQL